VFLQGKSIFSALDLRYAYMGLKMDEKSRPLTTFLTPNESFWWISLPTGLASSPIYFEKFYNKILHFEPVLDEKGNPVFEKDHIVKMVRSPLTNSINFFDDIITCSEMKETYELSLRKHFHSLAIKRLAFHNSKINVSKSDFEKLKINYLGWIISNNNCHADPKRIEKIKNTKFPENKKGMRAFLGLTNSLSKVTG